VLLPTLVILCGSICLSLHFSNLWSSNLMRYHL